MKKNQKNSEEALAALLEKYEMKPDKTFKLEKNKVKGDLLLLPGYEFTEAATRENEIPLLTWRFRRKFIELKKIVDDSVIENVCLFRFCCMGNKDKWSLTSLLYRELDLFEFLGKSKITSLNATITSDAGNVVATLESGAICCIEVSTQLPKGNELIDRHEIIASRGVASDQPVDTQAPMSSIYCYTKKGEKRYTDIDFELYDMHDQEIDHIRSAFQVLNNPGLGEEWQKQHNHLLKLVQAAFKSDKEHVKIKLN